MKYDLLPQLLPLVDMKYRDFHLKLVPEADRTPMLGVRMPELRRIGKELARSADANAILHDHTPDTYHEETIIRGVVIGAAKLPLDERLAQIAAFVPYIHNWAICDTFISGLRFQTADLPAVRAFLQSYLLSTEEFPARFGAVMLLRFFVQLSMLSDTLNMLIQIPATGYNARMAVAWALAECIVKFPAETLPFLEQHPLDTWTYRKTLQKALESRRLSPDLRPILQEKRKNLPKT